MKVGDKVICKKYYFNNFASVTYNINDVGIISNIYTSNISNIYTSNIIKEIRYEISNKDNITISMNEIRFNLFFKNINVERVKKLKKLNNV